MTCDVTFVGKDKCSKPANGNKFLGIDKEATGFYHKTEQRRSYTGRRRSGGLRTPFIVRLNIFAVRREQSIIRIWESEKNERKDMEQYEKAIFEKGYYGAGKGRGCGVYPASVHGYVREL